MKSKIIQILVGVCVFGTSGYTQNIPYPIRDIDPNSEKFNKIYAAVKDSINNEQRVREFVIFQRINPNKYIVQERIKMQKIVSRSSMSRFGGGGVWGENIIEGKLYMLEEELNLADERIFKGLYDTTENIYTHGSDTVNIIKKTPEYTKDVFITELKGGKIYKYKVDSLIRCKRCMGFGRTEPKENENKADAYGKIKCPDCKGVGKTTKTDIFAISW